MIPNKMTVLRASYTPQLRDLITDIGNKLSDVIMPVLGQSTWELEIPMPWVLSPNESFLIRQELAAAGWAGVFRSESMEVEILKVYIPIRT